MSVINDPSPHFSYLLCTFYNGFFIIIEVSHSRFYPVIQFVSNYKMFSLNIYTDGTESVSGQPDNPCIYSIDLSGCLSKLLKSSSSFLLNATGILYLLECNKYATNEKKPPEKSGGLSENASIYLPASTTASTSFSIFGISLSFMVLLMVTTGSITSTFFIGSRSPLIVFAAVGPQLPFSRIATFLF